MNLSDLDRRIQQAMQQARVQKLACNPVSELAMFKYYQGRQEAYENCLNLLKELKGEEEA